MSLKLLSVPELDFYNSWNSGWNKIKNMSGFDKTITIFWLLGPFIYLIERDPADLWLSSISLIFLIRCIKNKDWNWATQFWFRSALVLWIFGLLSALTGPEPLFSFQQGFVWIRFPLYAAAAQVWLAKDRDVRIVMLISMLIGMLIMSAILIAETFIEPKVRLTWPYGDKVPGNYIARVSLPLLCVLMAIAVSRKSRAAFVSGCIGMLSIIVSLLTGERVNFLIRACGGMLAALIWKPKFILYFSLVLFEVVAILVLALSRPDLSNRFGESFVKAVPLTNMSEGNSYWGSWRGGIQQALIDPIKGTGPSSTRKICKTLEPSSPSWLPGKNYCGNHPHNYYIQLLAETGIIGLIIGCVMFISIIMTCYKARKENFDCPMAATAFVIPFGLYFPLQQFGSFYGQWGNLFSWFAIAFALSQVQSFRRNTN
ncbi:O-antigen ligase family protein [Alphaproteobacteria bacterium]|nr:O-antigen ligase family protein [Alphaproteobacteria bacterium]